MDTAFQYDPLDYYKDVLKKRHEENIREYFDALTKSSGIDVGKNRETVKKHSEAVENAKKLKSRLSLLKFFKVLLYIIAAVALILSFGVIHYGIGISVAVISLLLIFLLFNKKIKTVCALLSEQDRIADGLYREALAQMECLNALFTEEATLELFEKTNPRFHFEKNYSEKTSQNLIKNFDKLPYDNEQASVLDTLSGYYNENPFVYLRTLHHTLGTEIYHGYRTISWTESYRDSKGNSRTRVRTQTLHAQVSKPKPYYSVDTVLHFGATGAPNLSFSREGKEINLKSDRAIEKAIEHGGKKLEKKAQQAISRGESFVTVTNTEFDVLFGALDRDNEVEFRLMYTPLAQANTVELIRSDDTYGDDFSFYKMRRHNVIRTLHGQKWSMESEPVRYHSYSYDDARQKFESFNNLYFKSVYFDFAPLLAVPVYQEDTEVLKTDFEYGRQSYANEEYEAMANAIGAKNFAHEFTNSNIILKARYLGNVGNEERIEVVAHSYATESRVDTVMVFGGDGRMHAVLVPWVEYIPVWRNCEMFTHEATKAPKEKTDILSAVKDKISAYVKTN
jgi:hypothetical protein